MVNSADEILFRASSIGKIMGKIGLTENQELELTGLMAKEKLTDLQAKKLYYLTDKKNNPELPQTIKTHLMDLFISSYYGRREEIENKFLRKGNECEEDSITLLSRITKKVYYKNTTPLADEHFSGEWDMDDSKLSKVITHTLDSKTSWSLHTFLRSSMSELNMDYFYQGHVYMALTGAKKHTVAFCLVNSTAEAIDLEKRYLSYKPGMMDANGNPTEEYKKKCCQIEINHIFDIALFCKRYPYYDFQNEITRLLEGGNETWDYDIPKEDRVFLFEFERDEGIIQQMRDRVVLCRRWMEENLFK